MRFALFGFGVIAIIGALVILQLQFLNRNWWNVKLIRRLVWVVIVMAFLGWTILGIGMYLSSNIAIAIGAICGSLMLVTLVALIISLPFSGILNTIANRLKKRDRAYDGAVSAGRPVSRRTFLHRTAAVFPMAALGAGSGGFAASFSNVKVFELPLYYSDLPPQLDGFRILHLSDLHLGRYFQLTDLENVLTDAEQFRPDLVLLTGDICDVPKQLPETLRMISASKPRAGCAASIGNHEYYHGLKLSLDVHAHSDVPLFINNGFTLDIDGAGLYLCGADDPARLFADIDDFLGDTVRRSLDGAPFDAFKIIMSHRPRGFVMAADLGTELTLSGHTHGGQIAFRGKSMFETTDPPNFYWGHYRRGGSQLYTSSGVGHWFPFRLGCPAEAPVIVLRNSEQLT
ncbi:MAG: metallophosphoesterase [candidate division Zixibacteria bacterium]|nr:metallophosphoesterase [candidate division Zixibacteria bacterium]MBU1470937.1 metallophosphoesterase [candidate division Zixibacteria bacterium]MBU2625452.1 metallophosphoesterase [candidate division Zixibacteria bacterium]